MQTSQQVLRPTEDEVYHTVDRISASVLPVVIDIHDGKSPKHTVFVERDSILRAWRVCARTTEPVEFLITTILCCRLGHCHVRLSAVGPSPTSQNRGIHICIETSHVKFDSGTGAFQNTLHAVTYTDVQRALNNCRSIECDGAKNKEE